MYARPLRLLTVLIALSLTAACETQPPAPKLPEIGFADKTPFSLNVGQLEIVSEYKTPGRAPNVDQLMQISPEAAAVRWAKDRIKPMGRTGSVRVVIKDGSVVEVSLKTEKGFTGLFKDEPGTRYDGKLDVAIQILDERHLPVAEVVAHASHSRSLLEGITVNERDKALWDISNAMIHDIDDQMDGMIRSYFARWVMM